MSKWILGIELPWVHMPHISAPRLFCHRKSHVLCRKRWLWHRLVGHLHSLYIWQGRLDYALPRFQPESSPHRPSFWLLLPFSSEQLCTLTGISCFIILYKTAYVSHGVLEEYGSPGPNQDEVVISHNVA